MNDIFHKSYCMIFNMQSLLLIHSFHTILIATIIFDWYVVKNVRSQNNKHLKNEGKSSSLLKMTTWEVVWQ